MGRLADTLKRATDAKSGLETAVEQDVAKYVERVRLIDKRREDIFLAKHGALDTDMGDLVEFDQDLEDFAKNDRSGAGGKSSEKSEAEKSSNAYKGTNPPKL